LAFSGLLKRYKIHPN